MRRRSLKFVVLAIVATASLAVWASVGMAGNNVGAFEIDGNTPDDTGAGDPIDWGSTPAPPNLTQFTDDTLDTQFSDSKWDNQAGWTCNTGSTSNKTDITGGQISFRTVGTDQFAYVNWTRSTGTGSVSIDYEFNQSGTNLTNCPLPQRTVGDIVIAFEQTGQSPRVRVLQWNGTGFTALPVGAMGTLWDAAFSANRLFGEASINISAILKRTIGCNDFASVHMDSRASDSVNANMEDRTPTTTLNFANCPASTLKKEVRTLPSGTFASSASAGPNDTVEYKFTYNNTGGGQASNVVVTDELPAGTTFVSGTGCSLGGDAVTITCSFGNVAGGGTASGTFQVKLPGSFPQVNNTITNVGSVDSTEEAPKDSNTATVNVTANPNSTLEKTAKNDTTGAAGGKDIIASPGDQVTYTFSYTNTGTSPAHNVTITDTVPTGTSFVSGNGCTNNAGAISCPLGTVNSGAPAQTVSFTVKLDASFPSGQTVITNTGKVKTDEEPEKPSNPSTVTVSAAPNVSLAKSTTTEGPVGPGDQITYTLAYANSGNAPATGQVINEPIPAGTKFISCTGGCTTNGPPITNASWNIGTIPANNTGNGSVTITVEVIEDEGAQVCNTASIGNPQASAGVNSNQVCLTREDVDSQLEKTAKNDTTGADAAVDITASPGDQVTYTFKYTNTGTTPAHNVTITDTVPTGTSFVSGSGCTNNAGAITCSLGTVQPNDPKTVSFTVKLDDSFPAGQTVITNTGKVKTDEEPEKPSNPSTVTVSATPNVTLLKSASTEGPVSVDDQITYTLAYANSGNAPATGQVINEPIPTGTAFVSCTGGCATNGPPITNASWNIGNIPANNTGNGSVTITVRVLAGAGEQICNTATIGAPQATPVNSNQICIGGEDVRSTLTKTAKNERTGQTGTNISAIPGDKVTYTFSYKNEGTTSAHHVVITDEIQDHTSFDSGTGCTHAEGIVTCDLGTVGGGATKTASFTVVLDSSFPAGETTINNTATVVTDEDGPADSNPTTVTVTAAPDLSVTKTTNQSVVAAGGQITYTLVYANEGNADATNVTITEATPVGTKWVSCNPTCTQTGTPPNVTSVSWNVGTVEGGDGGSLTYVVEVLDTVGCTVCNIATIASIDQDGPDSDTAGGDPISSNQLCIGSNPGPRPAGANANGTATGLHLEQALLGINTTLPANADGGPPKTSVDSSQSGIGTDGEDRSVLTVNVPNPTGVLAKVQAVRASTVSTVSGAPARAGTLSVAETAGVNLLNGVVTADLVRAVAGAEATGESARNDSGPSGGSSFVNLKVLGKAVKANVAPGTTIDLPDLVFGNDSYVKLMEVNNSTSRPGPNEQSGGTYSADTTVTAIRVRISSPTRTDIIISQAKAHADFPQTQICEAMRRQSVSGHAYTASEITNPPILPALVGFVQIPASGGFAHQQLAEASIGEPNYVVLAKATETHSLGVLNPASSDALSYAAAADVCVLRLSPTSCLIQSGLVRSQANSRATSAGASSHDTGTTLATLVVAGVRLPVNVPRNTVIPLAGLGFVVLNEQFCDNGATLPSCAGATSTGLTVRSVRVVVTVPSNPFGIAAGAQIIVNEAHSDASFVP